MDAITQQTISSLQPDAQLWFENALRPSVAIRQASSTEQKQQLTMEMARKAKQAPADMVKVFMEAYAAFTDIKDRFECSGRQPTKEEGDRNEAVLGYRSPTAFLNAVAGEIGVSVRTLRRHLDATYFYHFELTLPEDQRCNPCMEAACTMWEIVRAKGQEERLRIMEIARHEAIGQRDGKLSQAAAAACKKALECPEPQAVSVVEVTERPRDNIESKVVEVVEVTERPRNNIESKVVSVVEVTEGPDDNIESEIVSVVEVTEGPGDNIESEAVSVVEVTEGPGDNIESEVVEVTEGAGSIIHIPTKPDIGRGYRSEHQSAITDDSKLAADIIFKDPELAFRTMERMTRCMRTFCQDQDVVWLCMMLQLVCYTLPHTDRMDYLAKYLPSYVTCFYKDALDTQFTKLLDQYEGHRALYLTSNTIMEWHEHAERLKGYRCLLFTNGEYCDESADNLDCEMSFWLCEDRAVLWKEFEQELLRKHRERAKEV